MTVHGFVAEDLGAMFRAKLASSGLDLVDSTLLNLSVIDAAEVARRDLWNGYHRPPAIEIIYTDPWGDDWRYSRYRAIRIPAGAKKFPKYTQVKGSPAHAYFPTLNVKWPKVLTDASIPLVLTEGELKAAKACKEGFPTISLGGVYSFQMKSRGVDFLPELDRITWTDRPVYIAYDSDIALKPEVRRAQQLLANHLIERGAIVARIVLPQLGTDKTGLDDFLLSEGAPRLRALLAEAIAVEFDWRLLYQAGDRGPHNSVSNVMIALEHAPELKDVFGYDLMQQSPVLRAPLLSKPLDVPVAWFTESDAARVQIWLQRYGDLPTISFEVVFQATTHFARDQPFHPVCDRLNALAWDEKKRLTDWMLHAFGVEANLYHRAIGRMFIIAMVARVMDPGCQMDYMLVLEGEQGTDKSSALRILGDMWFSDNLPDLHRDPKRLAMHLRGKWLIEDGELAARKKSGVEDEKAFLSRREEVYTPMYGRAEVHEKRQCVIVASTNDDVYLYDDTGARRFWPVIVGRIDLSWLRANRDQIFAEAVVAYRAGEPWWPDRELEAELFKPEQAARFAGGEWDDPIAEYLAVRAKGDRASDGGAPEVTTGEVATGIGLDLVRRNSDTFRRIAAALKRLGCRRRKTNGRYLYRIKC